MDRPLTLLALVAIPLLAAVFYGLTRMLAPMTGYALGLGLYWALLATALAWRCDAATLRGWLVVRWPGAWVGTLCVLAPAILLGVGALALYEVPLAAAVLALVVLGAVLNGTLEELFWRGAILPRPGLRAAIAAVVLFTGWHLALLAAQGVTVAGGPMVLLGGAAALGIIWMAARLRSGTPGIGILSHVALNLGAFAELAARNTG